MNYSGWYTGT